MTRRPSAPSRPTPPAPESRPSGDSPRGGASHGVLAILREWADALVVAFVATMFFRIFMVELFKIPSGSMTPTLIGGKIATIDVNHDGKLDLVLFQNSGGALAPQPPPLVYLNDGRHLVAAPGTEIPLEGAAGHERFDRILVNKMAYWFHPPKRGDIVVFKVPAAIWEKDKPIYIKRCVGLPDEVLGFDGEGRLTVNGRKVSEPEFFEVQRYIPAVEKLYANLPEASYSALPPAPFQMGGERMRLESIHVPSGKIYVFGDNTAASFDGRYWGGVPIDNVKGRAFFRYWPMSEMKFFKGS